MRAEPAPDELSLLDLATPLVRRWRLVFGLPALAAMLALGTALAWPARYTAAASFTPEQPGGGGGLASALGALGGLGGLAGLGILSGSLGGGPSSEFFAGVLQSRELLEATLASPFQPEGESRPVPLQELLRPRGSTPERRRGNALRKLEKQIAVTVDRKTGIVTVAVTQRDPKLAADVANRMTSLLNTFNLERRQTSSREQRRFTEGRLRVARSELADAEQREARFLVANRRFQGSPLLAAEASRLEREVRMRQDVVSALVKAFEEARIAEVRDTPMITVIDNAAPPDRKSFPRPGLWTATAFLLTLAATAVSVVMSSFRDRRIGRSDVVAFEEALVESRAEVRALVRRP